MSFRTINPELKTALSELPDREKDKMLLRLLKKDPILIEQLHFQLLEDEEDLLQRKKNTFRQVTYTLEGLQRLGVSYQSFFIKNFLLILRAASGYVNHYRRITKDPQGELELRVFILEEALQAAAVPLHTENYANQRLLIYLAGRFKNLFSLYDKLHEDLQFDFTPAVNALLENAYAIALKSYLIDLGIPKEL